MLALFLTLQTVPATPPVLSIAAAKPSAPAVEKDWGGSLRTDAQALHDDIAANHAGPYNRNDPGFAKHNDAALVLALRRVAQVHGYAGYWFAMRGYVASFDDGHLGFGTPGVDPPWPRRWPGFLTAYDGQGRQVVVTHGDDAAPPLGARLVSCDGQAAEALAATLVGAYQGRWMLTATRLSWGYYLFVDRGNPFVTLPVRCRFAIAGAEREVALTWRSEPGSALRDAIAAAGSGGRYGHPIGARTLADGTRWYALGSFDGDPASTAGKALPGLIAGMAADRPALAGAPRIVLDLRGNNGGSSDWSQQIGQLLWGKDAVSRVDDGSTEVDWRASPANIATMTAAYEERRSSQSPETVAWFQRSIAGMRAAAARREPLWRDTDQDTSTAKGASTLRPRLAGQVYVVTDSGCASACLDALDLWRALGAIHVGRETSADTLYMDIRQDKLPSGLGEVAVPMKVYKGRKRGSNESVVPIHRFDGDITDTPALERWIAGLRG